MFDRRQEITRTRIGAIAIASILIILVVLCAPRVTDVQPAPDSTMVPSTAQIRLQFNQPMDKVSVETRLSIEPQLSGSFDWHGNTMIFLPDGKWAQGETVKVQLAAGARSSYFLPIIRPRVWSFEIGVPRIVYLKSSTDKSTLQVRTPELSEGTLLSEGDNQILDFSVSKDGTKIVYTVLRDDGGTDLLLIDLINESTLLILECQSPSRCQNPHLSPENDWMFYEQVELHPGVGGNWLPGEPQLFLMHLEQESEQIQIRVGEESSTNPAWSSRGAISYYDGAKQEIVIADFSIPPMLNEMLRVGSALQVEGNWSPDGEFILYPNVIILDETHDQQDLGREEFSLFYSHIFRLSMRDGIVTDLTGQEFGLVEDASPAYSPDGFWIAFTRKFLEGDRWTPGRQLWLMRADGTQPRQITRDGQFNHFSLSWSPDSTKIVLVRVDQDDLVAPLEIWIYDLVKDELSFFESGAYLPCWLP